MAYLKLLFKINFISALVIKITISNECNYRPTAKLCASLKCNDALLRTATGTACTVVHNMQCLTHTHVPHTHTKAKVIYELTKVLLQCAQMKAIQNMSITYKCLCSSFAGTLTVHASTCVRP